MISSNSNRIADKRSKQPFPYGVSLTAKAKSYYETLGLWRDASDADIRSAYRHLARLHHPDVSQKPDAAEHFRAIQEAYDVLSDPAARASFDATFAFADDPARSRSTTGRDAGARSDRYSRTGRQAREAREQTRPQASKQDHEARAGKNYTPASPRAVEVEARKSWKKIAGLLAVLGPVIAACAMIVWLIRIGTKIGTGTGLGPLLVMVISVQIAIVLLRFLVFRGPGRRGRR